MSDTREVKMSTPSSTAIDRSNDEVLLTLAALGSSARAASIAVRKQGEKDPAAEAVGLGFEALAEALHTWHEYISGSGREDKRCQLFPGQGNGMKWYDMLTNTWGGPC